MSEDEKNQKELAAAQPSAPDADKIREIGAVELSAEARVSLDEFTARLDALIAKMDANSDDPLAAEATTAVAQLRELKDEAAKLEKTFLQRLGVIARKPVELWARLQEKKIKKQLEQVDNPKIIARLDKMLDNQEIPVEDCIELYRKAAKREFSRNWREVELKLDSRILLAMNSRLREQDVKAGIKLFSALSRRKQEQEAGEVMRSIWSPLSEGRPHDNEFSYSKYSARLAAVQKYEAVVEPLVKSVSELWYEYDRSRGRMYEKSFSALELFLMKQKEEAVAALADFGETTQRAMAKDWQARAEDGSCWEKLLLDPRHLRLVPVFLEHSDAFSSSREEYVGRDIENLNRIAVEFPSVAERKRLWQKTGVSGAQTLDSIYIYLSIASLSESTTEQIKRLDREQLEHISLLIFAYGKEKLKEMWNEDNLLDLKEIISSREHRPERVDDWLIAFTSSLTPTLRRHLPTIEQGVQHYISSRNRPERKIHIDMGFIVVGKRLNNFKLAVESVPGQVREQLFSVLRPMEDYSRGGYNYNNREWPYLDNPEPEAFVEFCELTGFVGKFTLAELTDERQWLKSEEWAKIKQGIETSISSGLTPPGSTEHVSLSGLFNFYQKVGQPEHGRINGFLKNCQSRSDKFLRKQDTRSNKKTEVAERGLGSAIELYYFSDACEQYFSKNPDAMAQFMNLSEDETVVIKKWVSGEINDQTAEMTDLPVIEGIIVDLGHRFKEMYASAIMESFAALTGEQQGVFLCLSKDIVGLNYGNSVQDVEKVRGLVTTKEGVGLAEFINKTGLKGYFFEAVKLMATRPDCAPLFRYFAPPGYVLSGQTELSLSAFNKMIALKDVGLPEKFGLDSFSEKLNFFSENEIANKFINFEPSYLAQAAQLAEKYFPELGLIELIKYLEQNLSSSDLEKQIQMAGLLKSAFYIRGRDIPDQAEIDKLQGRMTATGDLFESDLFKNDLFKNHPQYPESHFRYRLRGLPENVWGVAQFSPDTLKNVLVSGRDSLPESAAQLPRELLANPIIWRHKEIPDAMFENEQDLSDLLSALKIWQDGGVDFKGFIGIKPVCDSIINAYRNNQWLFEPESVDVMKDHFTSVDYFSKLSENEWRGFQEYFNYFYFQSEAEIKDAVAQARGGALPLSPRILATIKSQTDKIPWSSLAGVIEMFTEGAELEAVVELLGKNKYSAALALEWNEPNWVGQKLFEDQEWQKISVLPAAVLKKLADLQLTMPESYSDSKDKEKFLENSIFIAQHQNFDAIKDFINSDWDKKHYQYDIAGAQLSALNRFCDAVFPGFTEKVGKLPANLRFNILDLPDFLNLPDADKKVDFAAQLLVTFGEGFRVSIYDLMTINTDSAPDLLRGLADKCFFALDDPKRLDSLAQVTTGEEQKMVQKLLSNHGTGRVVDFSIVYDDIKNLPLNLRRAVLLEKGPHNYGWSILPFREQIIAELGLSQEEYAELVVGIYLTGKNSHLKMPKIDFEDAVIILENVDVVKLNINSGKSVSVVEDVIKNYEGDLDAIIGKIAASERNSGALVSLTATSFSDIPESYLKLKSFWLICKQTLPGLLALHYDRLVSGVELSEDDKSAIVENGNYFAGMDALLKLHEKGAVSLSDEQRDQAMVSFFPQSELSKLNESSAWRVLFERQLLALVNEISDEPEELIVYLKSIGMLSKNTEPAVVRVDKNGADKLLMEVFKCPEFNPTQLDEKIDKFFGTKAAEMSATASGQTNNIIRTIVGARFNRLGARSEALVLDEDNWPEMAMAFARTTIDDYQLPFLKDTVAAAVTEIFKTSESKDFCLTRLQVWWRQYLDDHAGEEAKTSLRTLVFTEFIDDCEGAGPLTQIEGLALFMRAINRVLNRKDGALRDRKDGGASRTKKEIVGGLETMEQRFNRERWSNEDRTDFYNISRDIASAAPSLMSDFLKVFERLRPAELRRFHEEIYPLFRAELAIVGKTVNLGGEAVQTFKARDLVGVRRDLRSFAQQKSYDDAAFAGLKSRLVENLSGRFKERFGIERVPDDFTNENIRSLTNITLYLANLHARTPDKEKMLGWYLSLMVNGKWDSFRRGETLSPAEFLSGSNAQAIAETLSKRLTQSPLTPERLHIPAERMAEFQDVLQTETANVALGDVETVDTKLGNVITNLDVLKDPDLYPDQLDKDRLALLLKYGNKTVGKVAAKTFQQIKFPERQIQFSQEEQEAQEAIKKILADNGRDFTADNIKAVFQDGLKTLALIANVGQFVVDSGVEQDIGRLRESLTPNEVVIEIFRRLGEEFKPSSGALALTQDLDYLDNIIVKREDRLSPEEKEILQQYVKGVRELVVKLESDLDKIKKKFAEMNSSNLFADNPAFRDKLAQIDKIINAQATQHPVTSVCTGNLNAIIENIRQCLSCKSNGCNNDTDLTFGDPNKFFVYSHTEAQRKGSVADEIVFLQPIAMADGSQEMSFVMDKVYGHCTPFILTNHILAVSKKLRAVKERFPNAALSIFVTEAAVSTGGISAELLAKRLGDQLGKDYKIKSENIEVDIVPSAVADHYIEFGGGARENGKRKVSGLTIRL